MRNVVCLFYGADCYLDLNRFSSWITIFWCTLLFTDVKFASRYISFAPFCMLLQFWLKCMAIKWGFEPYDKTYTECLYSVIIVISAMYMLKPDLTQFFIISQIAVASFHNSMHNLLLVCLLMAIYLKPHCCTKTTLINFLLWFQVHCFLCDCCRQGTCKCE